ncbi:metallophosphoesterase [Saccharicrinis fermentans]|uniref:Putative phosphoesterase n=1 Tax=Saccharicrinis fermentans DSM 9555 = JCM 21142 TaxID=869213 RepID=W7YBB5_9BACT|nr:metallophosphoesterase [Saccharicrinis fermentans]GAF05732.1 putative phosphoesterase [Saccharicrinis fermentans DSM 9555 = JCM 21142]
MSSLSIQYCSDLHLEFPENEKFLKDKPIIPKANILILAGDIVPLKVMDKFNWFWDKLSEDFERVYWVPGNHEYYHGNLSKYNGRLSMKIRNNISLVNNFVVTENGVRLIFSTLWSRIKLENKWVIERRLNDFHLIKNGEYTFTSESYNRLHKKSLEFVTGELKKAKQNKVVVCSHHVPTFLNYPEKYKGDSINDAFATELFPLIEEYQPEAWIFGHHHWNHAPFTIGKTQMLTNQLGYVRNNEHEQFNASEFIKI